MRRKVYGVKKIYVIGLFCTCILSSLVAMEESIEKIKFGTETYKKDEKAYNFFNLLKELEQLIKKELNSEKIWLANKVPKFLSFIDKNLGVYMTGNVPCYPFIQKIELSDDKRVVVIPDLHGDKKTLDAFIIDLEKSGYLDKSDKLRVANTWKDKLCIVFLGDYVDRGINGIGCWQVLAELKKKNPQEIVLLRGNHEDKKINDTARFTKEIAENFWLDFKEEKDEWKRIICRLYNLLPVAVCFTHKEEKEKIVCVHGCLEPGYFFEKLAEDKRPYLFEYVQPLKKKSVALAICSEIYSKNLENSLLKRLENIDNLQDQNEPCSVFPGDLNFLWGDINFSLSDLTWLTENDVSPFYKTEEGRVLFSQAFIKVLLKKDNIALLIRAHQHGDDSMPFHLIPHHGLYQLGSKNQWSGSKNDPLNLDTYAIVTFAPAPFNGLGEAFKYDFFTYGVIKHAKNGWSLTPYKIEPHKLNF